MRSLELDALVDEQGRLVLDTPLPFPPGRVRVTVHAPRRDDDDAAFRTLGSAVWAQSVADPAEDVYTESDGVPINPVTGEPARQ